MMIVTKFRILIVTGSGGPTWAQVILRFLVLGLGSRPWDVTVL